MKKSVSYILFFIIFLWNVEEIFCARVRFVKQEDGCSKKEEKRAKRNFCSVIAAKVCGFSDDESDEIQEIEKLLEHLTFGIVHGTYASKGHARERMENNHFPQRGRSPKIDNVYFYGIYDGHGGSGASWYTAQHLHKYILYAHRQNPRAPFSDAIYKGFLNTHNCYEGMVDGTTAVIAIIRNGMLFVANVGDSRAVMSDDKIAKQLSYDHKPEDPYEYKRITKQGGKVTCTNNEYKCVRICTHFTLDGRPIFEKRVSWMYRVNGGLSASRAIGDHLHRRWYDKTVRSCIIPDPFINTINLTNTHQFLILGCNGLWDVMTNQAAVDFVHIKMRELGVTPATISSEIAYEIARSLVNFALSIWDHDNVSATIIFFHQREE